MAKYSIHATKQDWEYLYERIRKINNFMEMNDTPPYSISVKEAKKSQSHDAMDFKVWAIERKLGLEQPTKYTDNFFQSYNKGTL